ncbi:MAG: GyrI-like domain-containing protein [Planctomycetia bacterium]|nr:GyrI-like domain-containing protein [Planctomycetia bacterium]
METPVKKEVPEQTVIYLEHEGSYSEIGGLFRRLREWAAGHGAHVTGPGVVVFISSASELDSQSAVFEVCLPVEAAPKAGAGAEVKTLPACTVASVTVTGPYSDVPARYTEMLSWLDVEGMEVAGPPREVYIKHPGAAGGGEPEEFVTEIQFPIEP